MSIIEGVKHKKGKVKIMETKLITKMIYKVLGLIEKTGSEEEKAIAKELVEKVMPKKEKYHNTFYVDKTTTYYKAPNGKTYSIECQKDDKYNVFIGCALVYGQYVYGSRNKLNNYLKEFYGLADTKQIESFALIKMCERFGGRPKFENFVKEHFNPRDKFEELTK